MEKAVAKMVKAHRARDDGEGGSGGRSEGARPDRTPADRGAPDSRIPRHARRTPLREGRDPQEQRHRQRQRQDGDIQGRDPGLHGGGGRGRARHRSSSLPRPTARAASRACCCRWWRAPRPCAPTRPLVTADAGYHSEANLKGLYELGVPALIADGLMRRRDERFAEQAKYKALPDPLWDKTAAGKAIDGEVQAHGLPLRPERPTPASARPARSSTPPGSHCTTNGRRHHKFQGAKRDCVPCHLREQCLRHPERTPTRQVAFFEKNQHSPLEFTERMKAAIDSERGRKLYGRANRDGGARLRKPAAQQAAGSLHATNAAEGEHAVEPVLPGSQHREAGASWIREIGRRAPSPPVTRSRR